MPKRSLRPHYHALRAAERHAWGQEQEAQLERNLFSLPAFARARTVMLYASLRDEVPTHKLIERLLAAGMRVALPIASKKDRSLSLSCLSSMADLSPGLFGVPEPIPARRSPCAPSSIDVALIPGLAFDMQGHRLGHGLGYYDRFLPKLKCPLIGLAYDAQISAPALPREAHDHPVDYVVSEKRVVVCKRQ
ncbi:MAG: 5-formyltetrahydrofolate cyclo-ligase [Candidatus Marsarchaeota archaeon]|nr:5-formyltetrahydrofolate cyclo-ligase [Candidatus Marsarchaeota archaeon]